MNLLRYNKKYQRNIYAIGLDVEGDTKINPSTQFQLKKHKYAELNKLFQQKVTKMKSILQVNNSLMNSIVEEEEFSNEILLSRMHY